MTADLTLASYNIHFGRGLRWTGFQPFDVPEVCATFDADVLVLQESWHPDGGEAQHDAVAKRLGMHVVAHPLARAVNETKPEVVARLGPDAGPDSIEGGTGTWNLAVLSRLPITAHQVVPLQQLKADPVARAVLRCTIDVGGRPLEVCGTHLPHIQMGAPFRTGAIRRALPPKDTAAVFVGDMNTWSPLISLMAPPGWKRKGRGRTFPSPYPHSRIDHVVVTPSVEVVWSEVVRNTSSDHRPIRAGLRLR